MSKRIKKNTGFRTPSTRARHEKLMKVIPVPINHWVLDEPDYISGGVNWLPRKDAVHITSAFDVIEAIDEYERLARWCFPNEGADRGYISHDRFIELQERAVELLRERVHTESKLRAGEIILVDPETEEEAELVECTDGASPYEHTMALKHMGACPWCGETA